MIYFFLTLLMITSISLNVYLFRRIFDYQDVIDDYIESISEEEGNMIESLKFVTDLSKRDLAMDTPEIRRLVENVKRTKKSMEILKLKLDETKKNAEENEGQ